MDLEQDLNQILFWPGIWRFPNSAIEQQTICASVSEILREPRNTRQQTNRRILGILYFCAVLRRPAMSEFRQLRPSVYRNSTAVSAFVNCAQTWRMIDSRHDIGILESLRAFAESVCKSMAAKDHAP